MLLSYVPLGGFIALVHEGAKADVIVAVEAFHVRAALASVAYIFIQLKTIFLNISYEVNLRSSEIKFNLFILFLILRPAAYTSFSALWQWLLC